MPSGLIDARSVFHAHTDSDSAFAWPITCSSFSISLLDGRGQLNKTRQTQMGGYQGCTLLYISITHQLLFSYRYQALSTPPLFLHLAFF